MSTNLSQGLALSQSCNLRGPVGTTTQKHSPNSKRPGNGGQVRAKPRVHRAEMCHDQGSEVGDDTEEGYVEGEDYHEHSGDDDDDDDDDDDNDEEDDEDEDEDGDTDDGVENGSEPEEAEVPQPSSPITSTIAPASGKSAIPNRRFIEHSTIPLPRLPFIRCTKGQKKKRMIDRLNKRQKKKINRRLAGVLGSNVTDQQREVAYIVAKNTLEGKIKVCRAGCEMSCNVDPFLIARHLRGEDLQKEEARFCLPDQSHS
ncbi:hypothetical protein FRC02_007492 [Tulasnella sp. 418]|nr:hypothetical protein FRC02_007492 [Tulasnella sp. 418]